MEAAIAGYFVLLADSFLRQSDGHERAVNFRVGVAIVILLVIVLPLADRLESAVRPSTLDGRFRAVDLYLHLDGFALSRICLAHEWVRWLVIVVYGTLPLALALAWMAGRSTVFLRGAAGGAVAALPCYLLFPATGPQYAFAGWPEAGALVRPAVSLVHPRNCMPSMHMTWALLAVLNVRGKWRVPFAVYAVLMSVSAVAGGEHYFIDVLAAVPFTLAIQWAAVRLPGVAWTSRVLSAASRCMLGALCGRSKWEESPQ